MRKNKIQFIMKCKYALVERVLFMNVRNKNIRGLAYKEHCYKVLKRKYKKFLHRKSYHLESPENIIWVCWLQGIEKAPGLVRACINTIKKQYKDKKIVILTEENYCKYVKLPDYIIEKYKKGIITPTHFSDLLRLEALTTRGGLWLDSTVMLSGRPSALEEDIPLFVYKNISLDREQGMPVVCSSWLMKSMKNEPILALTKELLYEYWKSHYGLMAYSLVHIFFTISTEVYSAEWCNVPSYSNVPPHILQFELLNKYNKERFKQICKMSNVHKLTYKIEPNRKDSFYYEILRMYGDEK